MSGSSNRLVSIVMPALNEERYIASAIASLIPDEGSGLDYEILVMDGGSTDLTCPIVSMIARGNPAIRLIRNEKRIQSAGFNLAAHRASPRSTILLRADCHAAYPPGFVARCTQALIETGAASVVVPMLTRGRNCVQRAVAATQNSRLGNGGSAHRLAGRASGFVDHGHHAAFDRQTFLDLGGYDETFTSNEDAEYDRRLLSTGHRIWFAADAAITYFPRGNLLSLARQYAGHGAGRARTVIKQGTGLRLRQALPLIIFLCCALSSLGALLDPRMLIVDLSYAAICLLWGLALALRAMSPCLLLTGLTAMTMHLAWGFGFARKWLGLRLRAGSSALGASHETIMSGSRDR